MQNVFSNAAELERLSKEKFSIPSFLMMEHAASFMADFIIKKNPKNLLILCGKGNNGGDGFALARLLCDKCNVQILCPEVPTASEAKSQYEIYKKLGLDVLQTVTLTKSPVEKNPDIIVDCLYGTGFHGELKPEIKELLNQINKIQCLKIACDIPSALYFKADYTITMGEEKTLLFSDTAKAVCGKIIVSDLGLPKAQFESTLKPSAFLIEPGDVKLPLRKNPAAHKGSYGHTTIFAGEKAGAAILASTAAMHFGSGLTSLLQTKESNLNQFKISPQLMICNEIPKKTSAVLIGSGLNPNQKDDVETFLSWFKQAKNPAAVLDAGIFSFDDVILLLNQLNQTQNARVILTPHLLECSRLLEKLKQSFPEIDLTQDEIIVTSLANSSDTKIKIGKIFNQIFPNITLIIKSANTFIASGEETFICADGSPSLAKGGSGDVLAGMCAALLAQGYTTKDAAITAVEVHALTSQKIGNKSYSLTPELLIQNL